METIEEFVGRKLKPTEMIIYNMYKDNPEYSFHVDDKGDLIAIKE